MQETNGTIERILRRMDRRDSRFEKMLQEQLQTNRELADISKELALMVDRLDDRLRLLESR